MTPLPVPQPDAAAALAYLGLLFGTADGGYLAVWTLEDRGTAWFPAADLAAAAAYVAARSAAGRNAYAGMGLQPAPLGPARRGGAEAVCAIPGAWDDIDLAGPAHTRAALPATVDDALAVLAGFPLQPSLLVHSGHGLYPLWLFKEVWHFADDADRRRASELVGGVQRAIRRLARARGYDLETTADLARVLRPAGALNRKPKLPPAPVRLLEDSGFRYTVDELEAVLPDSEPAPSARRVWTGLTPAPSAPRADLGRILAGCPFLRRCRDAAATLDEPAWHALLSVVARCADGERHAHGLSAPHPSYDPDETARKFAYALAADKPLRCATIRDNRGGTECAACPQWGRIASPVVLGYAPIVLRAGERVGGRTLSPRQGVARVG